MKERKPSIKERKSSISLKSPRLSICKKNIAPKEEVLSVETPKVVKKVDNQAKRKRKLIGNIPTLSELDEDEISELVEALEIVKFHEGDYIIRQGASDKYFYLLEEGQVMVTVKKESNNVETQLTTKSSNDYFGDASILTNDPREENMIAVGEVVCMKLGNHEFDNILKSVHQLLLRRYQLRKHAVLDSLTIFNTLSPIMREKIINFSTLHYFKNDEYLCRLNEVDDRYFILMKGSVKVVILSNGHPVEVARKYKMTGFGEMGLFNKPRTANVISIGDVECIVIDRKSYALVHELYGDTSLDEDCGESMTHNLTQSWNMMKNIHKIKVTNTNVAQHLANFMGKFSRITNKTATLVGKTMYLDFFRRIHQNPNITLNFPSISADVNWFNKHESINAIYEECKRILSLPLLERSDDDIMFLALLTSNIALFGKFKIPSASDGLVVPKQMAKIMKFMRVKNKEVIFKEGIKEFKAYIVLSGSVSIVAETVVNGVQKFDVLATLRSGDSFGELSLVADIPRTASAIAVAETDLIVIDRKCFRKSMKSTPGMSIRHVLIDRASFLGSLDCFKSCDQKACIRLAHFTEEYQAFKHEVILRQKECAKGIYIVVEGDVAIFQNTCVRDENGNQHNVSKKVGIIGPRELFGISSLKLNQSSGGHFCEEASYMCATMVNYLVIPTTHIRKIDDQIIAFIAKGLEYRYKWEASQLQQNSSVFYSCKKPWEAMPKKLRSKNKLKQMLANEKFKNQTSFIAEKTNEIQQVRIPTERIDSPSEPRIECESKLSMVKDILFGSFSANLRKNSQVSPLDRGVKLESNKEETNNNEEIIENGNEISNEITIEDIKENDIPETDYSYMWKYDREEVKNVYF